MNRIEPGPQPGLITRWLVSRPEVRHVARFGVHYRLKLWPDGRREARVVRVADMPELEFRRLWEAAYDDWLDDID